MRICGYIRKPDLQTTMKKINGREEDSRPLIFFRKERVRACYLHTCLLYEDYVAVKNLTMLERFGLDTKKTIMISSSHLLC